MADNEEVPLLRKVPSIAGAPPMMVQPGVEKLEHTATLPENAIFPSPAFANARDDARKRKLPQAIAHRGYKAKYPENTMGAFKGAVEIGAHAIETDVHLTKDGVVVISHDANMKRCFGRPEKIIDCNWDELSTARTIKEPHEGMPRLKDVLEYLAQPGLEEIWLLLDIKLDNNADDIMRLIGSTIASVSPSAKKSWQSRVLLGCWAAKYLPFAVKYLPEYPITHIGFSTSYARQFFSVPNVSFNMLLPILIAPGGRKFIRDAQEVHHRQVLAWTVNEKDKMEWCIRRGLDGVITDDPRLYLEVRDKFDERSKEPLLPFSIKGMVDVFRVYVWIRVMGYLYRSWFDPVASQKLLKREGSQKSS